MSMLKPTDTKGYVDSDYLNSMVRLTKPIKQRSYELMQLAAGNRVLDIGCGPATDTLPISNLVMPNGEVIGVDHDDEMIKLANQRAVEAGVDSWVQHMHSSAPPLSFESNSFDACHSERVFQHVKDNRQLLSEMIRVTKPGGRVVVADTDHSSLSFDVPDAELTDIEWRLRQYRTEIYADGYAGRKLFRLFRSFGLDEIEYELFPLALTNYAEVRYFTQMDQIEQQAIESGVVTEDEIQKTDSAYKEADDSGCFFCYAVMVLVSAVKRG